MQISTVMGHMAKRYCEHFLWQHNCFIVGLQTTKLKKSSIFRYNYCTFFLSWYIHNVLKRIVLLIHLSHFMRNLVLRCIHMARFAYMCKYLHMSKYTHVCKSVLVNGSEHECKICTICKFLKFAPGWDQVQMLICIYANFAYMQICPCERKPKFAYMSISSFVPC